MQQVTVRGERWYPSERNFAESLGDYWGDWYCDSEAGVLKAVLMRRPGPELDGVTDPAAVRFKAPVDPETARRQHDALADLYRAHGVTVHYVEGYRPDRPNALFMRDQVLMTPEGAIVCRPAMEARRGEERFAAEALARLGVPILKTVNGDGIFEGACLLWVDRRTVILGTGCRANEAGARQVERELREIGVTDFLRFPIPFGHAHLDGLMNFPDRKTVMVFPWQVPYEVCRPLLDRGFRILENPHVEEVKLTFGINFVTLRPGKVVLPSGNPGTRALLEEAGVECVEADLSEIVKAWGATHCLTAFLRRDPI
ncbi:amidinotransferase [Aminomonas paucivorans DSM 12260]|uniref:Amidinotransferase n=1 Tax=Aminomonas paucivorans DSM 12260 TaxID=584708 RepID=E3CWG3_9BACT|nr:arginine deiminase family protein [Aminomonas paucivorans]EFQ24318.1 amidinotransferase [Aminomonas paucivorans DSM 12260]